MESDVSQLRHVVVDEPLTEAEVHPAQAYEGLRQAARDSAARLLSDRRELVEVGCPGCGASEGREAFVKDGFHYRSCVRCWSLYVSPRPSVAQQHWYLHASPYAEYRRSADFAAAMGRKAAELAQVRAEWLLQLLPSDGPVLVAFANSVELLERLARHRRVVAFEPLVDCAGLAQVQVVSDVDAVAADCAGLVLLDVAETLSNLSELFGRLAARLAARGVVALTTRSSTGLDVLTLQERCPTIFAPTHLNLLSVEGCHALMQRHGLHTLELSTPGLLDVEVLRRSLASAPDGEDARFFRYFLEHRGPEARARLQRFLQQTQTSSHVRLVATNFAQLRREST